MAVTQDKVSQRPQTLITPMIVLENGKVCGKRLILGLLFQELLSYLLLINRKDALQIKFCDFSWSTLQNRVTFLFFSIS